MDSKYHFECDKCGAETAYLHGYKDAMTGKWVCGKCYRQKEPVKTLDHAGGLMCNGEKHMKVLAIDVITPHICCVTYEDGTKRIIYEALTLEDLANMERQDRWMRSQLVANGALDE